MVEVRLHGDLAKRFGMRWDLDIATPHEAIAAIEANFPGFKNAIRKLEASGHCFRVRTKGHDYSDKDVGLSLGSIERVDIIPIVMGSSGGLRFVLGAALIAGVVLSGGTSIGSLSLLQGAAFGLGTSLVLGSIAEFLTPVASRDEAAKRLGSWTLNGPSNDVSQGQPVPIIYGEVLTGGYPISAGLAASDLSVSGSADPSASIGGQFDVHQSAPNQTGITTVFSFSVSTLNLGDPFTYAWSYAGFQGASGSISGNGTATIRLAIATNLNPQGEKATFTGSVTVTVTGKDATGETSNQVSVSATEAVTLSVDNYNYTQHQEVFGGA